VSEHSGPEPESEESEQGLASGPGFDSESRSEVILVPMYQEIAIPTTKSIRLV